MAKKKTFAVKFDRIDKGKTRNKVGHTRTGACPSKGRCYHGWVPRRKK